jgi:hypothetical protein
LETVFPRLQLSHFSGNYCTGYIYKNEDEVKGGVLGHNTTSYPRRIISWVMTLHHIPAVLGYDAASYPRRFCPGMGCIVSQRNSVLGYDSASSQQNSALMMLHPNPEDFVLSYAASYPNRILSCLRILYHIQENSVLGYDVSYPNRILSWVVMLHHPSRILPGLQCIISQKNCVLCYDDAASNP